MQSVLQMNHSISKEKLFDSPYQIFIFVKDMHTLLNEVNRSVCVRDITPSYS